MLRKMSSKDGVSPIIATILMVAVTIVLAGVLYVMIVQMSGGSSDLAPLGSWYDSSFTSNTTAEFVFGSFSYGVSPMDIRMVLESGTNSTTVTFTGSLTERNTNLSLSGDNIDTLNFLYVDANWEGNTVSAGDRLVLSGLEPNTVYYITVFHLPTDSVIAMSGASSQVQTPP